MADTTFVNNSTRLDASWCNAVNDFYYTVFGGAVTPQQAADAINAITITGQVDHQAPSWDEDTSTWIPAYYKRGGYHYFSSDAPHSIDLADYAGTAIYFSTSYDPRTLTITGSLPYFTGDNVTLMNMSSGDLTVTPQSGFIQLYLGGAGSQSVYNSKIVPRYGVATIYGAYGNDLIITGNASEAP